MNQNPKNSLSLFGKCQRIHSLSTFPNFLNAEKYQNIFDKDNEDAIIKTETFSKLNILATDYAYNSNIINCKLFESDLEYNEAMGLSQERLDVIFQKNQKIVDENEAQINGKNISLNIFFYKILSFIQIRVKE